MKEFDRSGIVESFLIEAEEHIHTLENGVAEFDAGTHDSTLTEELLRAAHTLKGASAIVRFNTISAISHRMEDILEGLRYEKISASKEIVALLHSMIDAVKRLVHGVPGGKSEDSEIEREIAEKTEKVLHEEIARAEQEKKEVPLPGEVFESNLVERRDTLGRRREDHEFFSGHFVRVNIAKIERLLNLMGEMTIKKNYLLQKIRETSRISDEISFTSRRLLKEVDDFAERYAYSLPSNIKYTDTLLSEFGEIEFDRYDELNLFSRKLQEITNDLNEELKETYQLFESFGEGVKRIDSLIKVVRTDISEERLIAIGRLFKQFVRPIKDMAEQHAKKIEFLISGEDIKIDRVVSERLFGPLIHIIRNAVSHGIERPEERGATKGETGLISLSAVKEGDAVVIEVMDDGKGVDIQYVIDKAKKLGLLSADALPSQEDALSIIFTPGFTTKEDIDMTSGRGMGLSAIRSQIAGINGTVEVNTNLDWGTTFKIRVPVSFAITSIVVFQCSGAEFALPANLVEGITVLPQQSEWEQGETIQYRGSDVFIKDLSQVFGMPGLEPSGSRPVIVCTIGSKKVGLVVDAIVTQEETIIKPMNRFLEGLPIYSGATISGDGKARLIVNPLGVFESLRPIAMRSGAGEEFGGRNVLIVDDSLSVRKYLGEILDARKLKVYAATNGVEALDILNSTAVDMVITDLEMPVMHGYELISRIKASDRLKRIPVVVLTSRSSEKHKEKALTMGVNDYLVKPFEEESLAAILNKYLSPHRSK